MDVRLRDLSTKQGRVGSLAESESLALACASSPMRLGFSATDRLTREGVAACAAHAVAVAKASALAKRPTWLWRRRRLPRYLAEPYIKDPFQIPLDRQIELLLAADAEMSRVRGVTLSEPPWVSPHRAVLRSTIGSRIHQIKMQSARALWP